MKGLSIRVARDLLAGASGMRQGMNTLALKGKCHSHNANALRAAAFVPKAVLDSFSFAFITHRIVCE